jgi:hypothetical protein
LICRFSMCCRMNHVLNLHYQPWISIRSLKCL